jgi:two-component system sensor histidine kinase UhpB
MPTLSTRRRRSRPAGTSRHPLVRRPRQTLLRRLFAGYTIVTLLGAGAFFASPATISNPPTTAETAIFFGAIALTVAVAWFVLRRAFAPLAELTALMRSVDPLQPGLRIETPSRDQEVVALTDAFNEMLDRLEEERRESGMRALAAQEEERRRISRELHDEVGQILTGLVLRGETLARAAPDDLRPSLEELRDAARSGAEEVRDIARRLRPESLDELGLQSALLALGMEAERNGGLVVERRLDRDVPLTADQELVVYRVAQESLTNVVRHAHAHHVELSLTREDGCIVLEVRDDGVGPRDVAARAGSGIRGMRERALLVGGTLWIARAQPHGTDVRLRLPATKDR